MELTLLGLAVFQVPLLRFLPEFMSSIFFPFSIFMFSMLSMVNPRSLHLST
jgi:hypothetical protein